MLAAVGLASALPAVVLGFPFFSHDGATHAVWYSSFSAQLWAGEFYPRWLQELNGGLGSPAFFYYPPVAYYLTAPLDVFFAHDPGGWRRLGVSAALAQVASGLCAYLWLRGAAGRGGALVAAALYVLMPYHLAFDLYRRGAFAELWTFVWMPLVLHFARRAAVGRGAKGGAGAAAAGLAVAYALLAATHLPVTLIFTPFVICYAPAVAAAGARVRALVVVSCALALGAGLASAYLFPALATQGYVRLAEVGAGVNNYENWFLFEDLWPWGGGANYFWLALNAAGLAACAYRLRRGAADGDASAGGANAGAVPVGGGESGAAFAVFDVVSEREAKFWAAASVVALLLMTPLGRPIWALLPPLQKVQFPWRFHAVLCVALAALLAPALSALRKPYFASGRTTKALALLLFAFWPPYALSPARRAYPLTRPHPEGAAGIGRRMELKWDTPEYRPRSAAEAGEEPLRETLARVGRDEDGRPVKAAVVAGEGRVVVSEWRPRRIVLRLETKDGATKNGETNDDETKDGETKEGALVRVSQFYYPLWSARAGAAEVEVKASAPDGLMLVSVPQGAREVVLRLERGGAERLGLVVSSASLLALLILLGAARRARPAAEE